MLEEFSNFEGETSKKNSKLSELDEKKVKFQGIMEGLMQLQKSYPGMRMMIP